MHEHLKCYNLQAGLVNPIVQMEHGPGAASACSRPQLNSMTLHEQLEYHNLEAGFVNPIVQMEHGSRAVSACFRLRANDVASHEQLEYRACSQVALAIRMQQWSIDHEQ